MRKLLSNPSTEYNEIYHGGYDFDVSRIYFYRTNMNDNPLFMNRIGIQVHYDVRFANGNNLPAGIYIHNGKKVVIK
ncbi:MAG: hypothetical protein IJP59_11265 [Muribaculaceae bacterium]|nr:hypothetical protein [Muribaculaceae bacterium]